jgi:5-methylcytosine-specific restriction endonuclease McrA
LAKVNRMFNRKRRGHRITFLMSRDGANCSICHDLLDRHIHDYHDPRYITFDHVVPRSDGGLDHLTNLRLAHQQCNNERGNDPIHVFDEGIELED